MAKEKQEVKKVEKVVEKKSPRTIAGKFQECAIAGAKDRKELAKKIIDGLASEGITTNVKGHTIREERVLQQISAMLRDIKNERGKKTNAWWSQYTITETETEIKIVRKE